MGKKNGKGKLYLKNQSEYEGEFKNDQFCGFGIYKFFDGKIYKGNWKDDIMDG